MLMFRNWDVVLLRLAAIIFCVIIWIYVIIFLNFIKRNKLLPQNSANSVNLFFHILALESFNLTLARI